MAVLNLIEFDKPYISGPGKNQEFVQELTRVGRWKDVNDRKIPAVTVQFYFSTAVFVLNYLFFCFQWDQ